jgi:hypothetical protein
VRTVLLAVGDSSDDMPVLRPITELSLEDVIPDARALEPGHDAGTRGRGLPIVQALAAECPVVARPAGIRSAGRFRRSNQNTY